MTGYAGSRCDTDDLIEFANAVVAPNRRCRLDQQLQPHHSKEI